METAQSERYLSILAAVKPVEWDTRGAIVVYPGDRLGKWIASQLQRDGSKAKVYQVRQVRAVILKNGLGGEA